MIRGALVLTAVFLVLIVGALQSGASAPHGTLAFDRWDANYTGQVYVMDVNTGLLIDPVVTADDYQMHVGWSPDGTRLIYEDYEPGGPTPDVIQMPFRERERAARSFQIVNDTGLKGRSPTLSPDGRYLAFISAGVTNASANVHVLEIDSGTVWAVYPNPQQWQASPAWSPDGTRLLFLARPTSGSTDTQTVSETGLLVTQVGAPGVPSAAAELVLPTEPNTVHEAIWDVDGKGIFYSRLYQRPAYPTIFHLDLTSRDTDGYRQTPLERVPPHATDLSLSADGEWLAFSGVRPWGRGQATLYMVRRDGTDLRQLTKPGGNIVKDSSPAWQPVGGGR